MCEVFVLSVKIHAVSQGSPADRVGIRAGERIISINGEQVTDEIDYQALSSSRKLEVSVSEGNDVRNFFILKDEWEPLGVCLDETEARTTIGGSRS